MPPLAQQIGENSRIIFEIDLNFLQRPRSIQRFGCATTIHSNGIMLMQNLQNRLRRAGQVTALGKSLSVSWKEIEQCPFRILPVKVAVPIVVPFI
jgi:kynurenine formamidase